MDTRDTVETVFTKSGDTELVNAYGNMAGAAEKAAERHDRIKALLETTGLAAAEAGAKFNELSGEWANAYKSGDQIENRLKSLMTHQGFDERAIKSVERMSSAMMEASGFKEANIKQASVAMLNFGMSSEQVERVMPMLIRQSRTLGEPIESLGMAMGKAFGAGNLGALKRMGVTIDDASFATWKATTRTTDWNNATQVAALRSLVLEGAIKGINNTAMPLGEIMNSAAARSDLFAARAEKAHEVLGSGSQRVIAYRNQLAGLMYSYLGTHAAQARFLGGATTVAGTILSGVGSIGKYAHSYNEIIRMYQLMRPAAKGAEVAKRGLEAATKADTVAEEAKAAVAGKEAAALTGVGKAATVSTAAKRAAVAVEQDIIAGRQAKILSNGAAAAGLRAGGGSALTRMAGGIPIVGGALAAPVTAGSLASVPVAAAIAGTALGGWALGSKIAEWTNAGGAREAKEIRAKAKDTDAFTEEMLASRGWRRDSTGAVVMPPGTKGRMRSQQPGLGGMIERLPDGNLNIRLEGATGIQPEDLDDMGDMDE